MFTPLVNCRLMAAHRAEAVRGRTKQQAGRIKRLGWQGWDVGSCGTGVGQARGAWLEPRAAQ